MMNARWELKQTSKIMSVVLGSNLLFEIPVALSESDETDSEEDELFFVILNRKRKWKQPKRITNYIEAVLPGLTAQQFQQHFRMSVEAYDHLLGIVSTELMREVPVAGRPMVGIEKQLLASIWLLATPDSYRSVGERFNLAKSSLSVCFVRIIKLLNAMAPRVIQWPQREQMDSIKRRFEAIAGLRNVIGAVDGTYIPIKAPKDDPQSYITRKCNYAFTLQAIADPCLKFIDIFIAYPGSVSDNRIFRNSDIFRLIRNNTREYFPNDEYIIADKAYPVLHWCIPPYINRRNLTVAQIYFNGIQASTRQVIERSFALLMGRFRRLKFLDMQRHDLIPATVLAAAVLHNICLDHEDILIEEYIREGIINVLNNDDADNPPNNPLIEDGLERRDELCRELYRRRNNQEQ